MVSSVLLWMWCSVREREEARCRVSTERERRHIRSSASDDKFRQLRPVKDPWAKGQQCRDQKPAAGCGSLLLNWKERRGRDENCHFLILSARNCLLLFGLAEPRVEESREQW